MSSDPQDPRVPAAPTPLVAAAGMTFVQGLLVTLGAVVELFSLDRERVVLGLTTTLFFAAYGLTLVACAWGMRQVRPWSRGPVLLAQLVWLGLAWNLRETWPLSVALVVTAAVVLAGLLHPRSIDALETARAEREG
ncbi:hypothetical protein SAMN04488570_3615 [Nocardioides scoriae]|uniref:Integral membrane protein n=1 Tax=Nocardioides scoriae TaxID=642780 RepID=A0A1H1XV69_9ACTN|nr:hypothetical protein [Nocardioides scoriae]SDT13170.1 hypothetical protein SAMN04488570_3615 [Nocardioides scoriae]